jgi:Ice-binding-like
MGATMIAFAMAAAVLLITGSTASAAIVPTVPLATSANYSVLGFASVTNTGPTILAQSLGLWSGSSITGFTGPPNGMVLAPGTIDNTNAAAQQGQADLTAAYDNAHGRPVNQTTTSELGGLTLQGGVYHGPSKSPLQITGPLVLDGAGNNNSVFIFQTDSTLITASSSTVSLINGAQECNVFWQVGSSATLGTGSVFAGNIMALSDISVTTGVTVHGRALARNAVTLDSDVFTRPTCNTMGGSGGTTGGGDTATGGSGGSGGGDTATGGGTPGGGTPGGGTPAIGLTSAGGPGTPSAGPGVPGVVGPPKTGGSALPGEGFPWTGVLFGFLFGGAAAFGVAMNRRTHVRGAAAGGEIDRQGRQ